MDGRWVGSVQPDLEQHHQQADASPASALDPTTRVEATTHARDVAVDDPSRPGRGQRDPDRVRNSAPAAGDEQDGERHHRRPRWARSPQRVAERGWGWCPLVIALPASPRAGARPSEAGTVPKMMPSSQLESTAGCVGDGGPTDGPRDRPLAPPSRAGGGRGGEGQAPPKVSSNVSRSASVGLVLIAPVEALGAGQVSLVGHEEERGRALDLRPDPFVFERLLAFPDDAAADERRAQARHRDLNSARPGAPSAPTLHLLLRGVVSGRLGLLHAPGPDMTAWSRISSTQALGRRRRELPAAPLPSGSRTSHTVNVILPLLSPVPKPGLRPCSRSGWWGSTHRGGAPSHPNRVGRGPARVKPRPGPATRPFSRGREHDRDQPGRRAHRLPRRRVPGANFTG